VNNLKANKIYQQDDAVSPVIGVILMVAITVILAAVIAAFVFSMGGTMSTTYIVATTASQITDTNIAVTYQGGPDHDLLNWINISVDNTMEHQERNPYVGYTWTSTNGTSGRDHVIVAGHFVDGTEQVILDTYV